MLPSSEIVLIFINRLEEKRKFFHNFFKNSFCISRVVVSDKTVNNQVNPLRIFLLQALLTIPVLVRGTVFDLVYDNTTETQSLEDFSSHIQSLTRGHKKILLTALYNFWGTLPDKYLNIPYIFSVIKELEAIIRTNEPLLNFEVMTSSFLLIENYY